MARENAQKKIKSIKPSRSKILTFIAALGAIIAFINDFWDVKDKIFPNPTPSQSTASPRANIVLLPKITVLPVDKSYDYRTKKCTGVAILDLTNRGSATASVVRIVPRDAVDAESTSLQTAWLDAQGRYQPGAIRSIAPGEVATLLTRFKSSRGTSVTVNKHVDCVPHLDAYAVTEDSSRIPIGEIFVSKHKDLTSSENAGVPAGCQKECQEQLGLGIEAMNPDGLRRFTEPG